MLDNRPSRGQVMMQHAIITAQRGTCSRLFVGAVIVRSYRIISTGYNGSPAGMAHCDHRVDDLAEDRSTCEAAVHAEANAISYAARFGIATEGAEMYVTHQPCLACAKLIINAGLQSVTFLHPYRRKEGVALLHSAGLSVMEMQVA